MSALNGFDRVLEWADFTEVDELPQHVDKGEESANIGVSWEMKHVPQRSREKIAVKSLTVTIIMPDRSINKVVRGKQTPELLVHERGHYNIIALGAREFYNKGLLLTADSDTTLTERLNTLFDEIWKSANAADTQYDEQTDHSINKTAQDQWNKAINNAKANPSGTVNDLPK